MSFSSFYVFVVSEYSLKVVLCWDGEEISGEIDKEVKRIIDDCYTKAKDIIMQHENVLHSCAKLLLEKEKINREEFEALFV